LTKERISYFVSGGIIFLIVLVFVARTLQVSSYSTQAFVEIGLFSDKVCSNGSYEMVVCPYTAPPYETIMILLAALLVIVTFVDLKRKSKKQA
jgi:hypothetical protein